MSDKRYKRKTDIVFEELTKLIIKGVFKKNKLLPTTRVLSKAMNIDRGNVLVVSLKKLEVLGIINMRPFFGSVVNDILEHAHILVYPYLLEHSDYDKKEFICDAIEVKKQVGRMIARMSTKKKAIRAKYKNSLNKYKTEIKNFKGDFYEFDKKFFDTIAQTSENIVVRLLMNSLNKSFKTLFQHNNLDINEFKELQLRYLDSHINYSRRGALDAITEYCELLKLRITENYD